jgi:hypothetical protein
MRMRAIAVSKSQIIESGVAKDGISIRFEAIFPCQCFCLTPIQNIPLVKTPLSQQITTMNSPLMDSLSSRISGYVTLSQVRRIVILHENDPEIANVPLVGIWVYSDISNHALSDDPIIWSACCRYANSTFLTNKVHISDNTFLLVCNYNYELFV